MVEKKEKRKVKIKRKRADRKKIDATEPLIHVQVYEGGRKYETYSSVKMKHRKPWRKPDPQEILSTIPGSVVSLFVKEGDLVGKDQPLMVFEAMKMHNVIQAPFSGTVEQVLVKPGEKLPRGKVMIYIRSGEQADSTSASDVQNEYYEDF